MFPTLRSRLVLSHILPLLIVVPIMGIALIYAMETRVLLPRSIAQLRSDSMLLINLAADTPQIWQDSVLAGQFTKMVGQRLDSRLMLLDNEGRLLASTDPADTSRIGQHLELAALSAALRGETASETRRSTQLDAEVAEVLAPALAGDGSVLGVVRLTYRLGNVYQDFMTMRGVVTGVLAIGLLIGIALALLLARSLIRPVDRMVNELQTMAASQALSPVPETELQEMPALASTFNALVERMNELEVQRRSLLANLVHELGRPLGALRSAIDALLGGASDDPDLRDEMLAGMADEIVLLQRLLDDLAGLYNRESGKLNLVFQPVNLSEWLTQLLLYWKTYAVKKDLNWQAEVADDLPVVAIDPGRLGQAIGNLISNAIKYTPARGTVAVSAGVASSQVFIRISDTGAGIAGEEQALIFTPFYRGQQNQRFPQGLGLGLSIAHDLIAAHGGRLSLQSESGQGSTFTVWLPLHPPTD